MRKGLVVLLAAVVVTMFAVPAMAGTDVTGFYRAKGDMSNFDNYSGGAALKKDMNSNAYVEQRLRLKFTSGEENVKAVAFFEFDSMWGDSNYTAARNQGSALGADSINIETKNIYVWFKVPDTSVDLTVGLQGQSDSYAGVLFGGADMAGIFANAKVDPVALRLGWSKWFEGATNKTDDVTLYLAEAKLVPTKDVKLGINLYYLTDDRFRGASTFKQWTPGVDVSLSAGPVAISGFAFYQMGKEDVVVGTDTKQRGFAVDLRGDLNAGPGKLFVETLYISGGDGSDPDKFKSIVTANSYASGMSAFGRTDMQILLFNPDDINTSSTLIGGTTKDLNNAERGIWHLAAGYTQKLTDKLTGKVGAGYLTANKLLAVEKAANPNMKKTMGTEVNANVNYNITKGLDFGLYAAYAFLGDFYKPAVGDSPDDLYTTYWRLNYAF